MFPIGTDRPQRRFPWVNISIIAINVVVFLFTRGTMGADGVMHPSPYMQEYMLQPNPRLYQFITYQFLHADIMHILGNMLFLYVFGNNLNEKIGHFGYLLCYLTGGVLAGCGQELTSDVATLGASGSISAVTGLFFVLLPRINIRVFLWIYFYVDVVLIPSMWFIAFSVAKDIVEARFYPDSGVAHYAHVAGSFSGIFIGVLLLGTGLVQRDHYDLLALISRWRRRRQYETLVRQGYDPFGKTAPSQVRRTGAADAPPPDPRIAELRDAITTLVHNHQLPSAADKYMELRNLDARQALPASELLDIANQLMSEGRYDTAAPAYEDFLRLYPTAAQSDQVHLILGLYIYSHYLPNPQRATELLRVVLPRLHEPAQRQSALAELQRLTGETPPPPTAITG